MMQADDTPLDLLASDFCWTLGPPPKVNQLLQSDDDVLADARCDVRTYRELLLLSLAEVQRLKALVDRQSSTIADLRRERRMRRAPLRPAA
jgi:hypothetical protein